MSDALARDLPRHCRTGAGEAKRAFRTEAEALAWWPPTPDQTAYPCTHCGNYHLGHPPKPVVWHRRASWRAIRKALRRSKR